MQNKNVIEVVCIGKSSLIYRSLSREAQGKVMAFCDVDAKKVNSFYTYEESSERPKPKIPIVHFTEARPPLVICMKLVSWHFLVWLYLLLSLEVHIFLFYLISILIMYVHKKDRKDRIRNDKIREDVEVIS